MEHQTAGEIRRGPALLAALEGGKSLMFIGAHPDDETTAGPLLARAAEVTRAVVICLTKGEGGRNLAGPDFDAALGGIRCRELAEACAVLGVEHRILGFWNGLPGGVRNPENLRETPEQAIARWERSGKDPKAALVRAIRQWKPDILITFDPDQGFTRHKEHRAVSLLAAATFQEVADPAKYPEQIREGLPAWRPERLYYVVNRSAKQRDASLPDVEPGLITDLIDGTERSPKRDQTYLEIALDAMARHETQFGKEARKNRDLEQRVTVEIQPTALIRAAEFG